MLHAEQTNQEPPYAEAGIMRTVDKRNNDLAMA
jgi:hypothetical protein